MRSSEIKKQALIALRGNWGLTVLATLILFVISIVVPTIIEIPLSGGFSAWFKADEVTVSADVVSIIITFILMPFSVAFYWLFLSLARSEHPKLADLFTIYRDWKLSLKVIGTSIVVSIFVLLWTLLLIIPGIIKSFSYSQTFLVLRDHPEYSMTEAITKSKTMMNGYKWEYFLLNLSFIGWGFLSLFTLGIGFLWLVPYMYTSLAVFYEKVAQTA